MSLEIQTGFAWMAGVVALNLGLSIFALWLAVSACRAARTNRIGPRPAPIETPPEDSQRAAELAGRHAAAAITSEGVTGSGEQPSSASVTCRSVRTAVRDAALAFPINDPGLLLLTPIPHPGPMSWHLHLAPSVHIDIDDGRSIPAQPPAEGFRVNGPSGASLGIAEGDVTPPPTENAVEVRVQGAYVRITESAERLGMTEIEGGEAGDRIRYLAPSDRVDRLTLALIWALDAAALGSRTQVMGYSPASWAAHEKVWLARGN